MKNIKFTFESSSSIAASILSFALTLIGFSKLTLTVWWHYIVTIFAVILLYFICFIVIEIMMQIYTNYLKRASINSDLDEIVAELENIINTMFELKSIIDVSTNIHHKKILIKQISILHAKAVNKIKHIDVFSQNPAIKNKFDIQEEKLFEEYKKCCEDIAKTIEENT